MNPLDVLRDIHLGRVMIRDNHADAISIFKGAELFEFFDILKPAIRKTPEDIQKAPGISVNAQVLIGIKNRGSIPAERNGGS